VLFNVSFSAAGDYQTVRVPLLVVEPTREPR
jgi:hypothetical protein